MSCLRGRVHSLGLVYPERVDEHTIRTPHLPTNLVSTAVGLTFNNIQRKNKIYFVKFLHSTKQNQILILFIQLV